MNYNGSKTLRSTTSADIDASLGQDSRTGRNLLPSLLSVQIPVRTEILDRALVCAVDHNMRISEFTRFALQDPALSLEIIRTANDISSGYQRPFITSVESAVITLGRNKLSHTLENLLQRPEPRNHAVRAAVEQFRIEGLQVSWVARIISGIANPAITWPAALSGLFSTIGHLAICLHLGETYLDLDCSDKRAKLNCRLHNDLQLDVERLLVEYLRFQKVPEHIIRPFDREHTCKNHSEVSHRFIVAAAREMVLAFREGRWEKYNPKRPLPSNSALRPLLISDINYQTIYQLSETFLSLADDSSSQWPTLPIDFSKKS